MDWKDILSQKVESGELEREEFVEPAKKADSGKTDTIEIVLDRKGRKGKNATIASGFTCDETALKEIASQLKSRLSTGGSARAGEILIQGDCRRQVAELLRTSGYKVRVI